MGHRAAALSRAPRLCGCHEPGDAQQGLVELVRDQTHGAGLQLGGFVMVAAAVEDVTDAQQDP